MKTSNQINAPAKSVAPLPSYDARLGDLYDHVTLNQERLEWIAKLLYNTQQEIRDMLENIGRSHGQEVHELYSQSVFTTLGIADYLVDGWRSDQINLAKELEEKEQQEKAVQAQAPAKNKPVNQQVH